MWHVRDYCSIYVFNFFPSSAVIISFIDLFFKRRCDRTYVQFFRSFPSTIDMQDQKNVLYYIFKMLFLSCFVHHHSRRLKLMFLQVLELSLYMWLWKAVIRGCTWWGTERYTNEALFPYGKKYALSLYMHWSSSLLCVVVLMYYCFFLKFNFSLLIVTFEVLM